MGSGTELRNVALQCQAAESGSGEEFHLMVELITLSLEASDRLDSLEAEAKPPPVIEQVEEVKPLDFAVNVVTELLGCTYGEARVALLGLSGRPLGRSHAEGARDRHAAVAQAIARWLGVPLDKAAGMADMVGVVLASQGHLGTPAKAPPSGGVS